MDNLFKFICCGSVDDGKSTLIGRLLLNTGNVKQDQLEDAKKVSLKNGSDKLELGFLLDGLLDEREQQITIDVAHRFFDYDDTRFHILDCPGHEQYTKNMAIAAAEVQSAILVIDLTKGVQAQTIKHLEICSLFQVENLCVCITKCDLSVVDKDSNEWDFARINSLENEIKNILKNFNFNYKIISISAVENTNIDTVLNTLLEYKNQEINNKSKKCITHIQSCRFNDAKRYYWGHYVDGVVPEVGKIYTLYPEKLPVTIESATEDGLITIKGNVDISRGHCVSNEAVFVNKTIKHYSIWFDEISDDLLLKHGTRVVKINSFSNNTLHLDEPIIFNNITDVKNNGFGIIIDAKTKKTIGASVFLANENQIVEKDEKGYVYWFTGLSGAGKTTLAKHLVSHFTIKPILLDADDVRMGINADLGFSKEDRHKNVNRIAQMAKLLSNQGFNVIVTCISKDATQRAEIKDFLGDKYVEIFVNRSLENCQKLDKKGLYKSIGLNNIVSGYEKGSSMTIEIDTNEDSEELSKLKLISNLKEKGYLE